MLQEKPAFSSQRIHGCPYLHWPPSTPPHKRAEYTCTHVYMNMHVWTAMEIQESLDLSVAPQQSAKEVLKEKQKPFLSLKSKTSTLRTSPPQFLSLSLLREKGSRQLNKRTQVCTELAKPCRRWSWDPYTLRASVSPLCGTEELT